MSDKEIANVSKEAVSMTSLLLTAYNEFYMHGAGSHIQSIVDEVHNELCKIGPTKRAEVVRKMDDTKTVPDGNDNAMGLLYSSRVYVSFDCKE